MPQHLSPTSATFFFTVNATYVRDDGHGQQEIIGILDMFCSVPKRFTAADADSYFKTKIDTYWDEISNIRGSKVLLEEIMGELSVSRFPASRLLDSFAGTTKELSEQQWASIEGGVGRVAKVVLEENYRSEIETLLSNDPHVDSLLCPHRWEYDRFKSRRGDQILRETE